MCLINLIQLNWIKSTQFLLLMWKGVQKALFILSRVFFASNDFNICICDFKNPIRQTALLYTFNY